MELKFKVKSVAEDIGVSPADIVKIVKDYTGTEKKQISSLSKEECDIVLDKITQQHAVDSFDAFFATRVTETKPAKAGSKTSGKETAKAGAKSKTSAKSQAKPPENLQAKSQTKSTSKSQAKPREKPAAGTSKTSAANAAFKKEEPKTVQQQPKKQKFVRELPPKVSLSAKEQPKQAAKPVKPNVRQSGKGILTDFDASNYVVDRSPKRATGPERSAAEIARQKEERERLKQVGKVKAREITAAVDISAVKVNAPPQERQKGAAVTRGETVVKHVDMRGTYVELDKYNERYESIAPQTVGGGRGPRSGEQFGRKQKINQKPNRKKAVFGGKQRETEWQKLKRLELERARKQQLKVMIPDEIVVSELAARLKVTAGDVIKRLMKLGEMKTINDVVDFDTAAVVAEELGAKVEHEKIVTIEERLFEDIADNDDNLQPRNPVVVVMGHVDHGKTSLLDKIRDSDVAAGEAGGITQHIGAYRVKSGGGYVTFLDTPGHEAFTAMRARGAGITDIAILVVAADDGIMPQTVEAINHAKAAGVAIIIAINKIDKEGANPERVKQELTEHEVLVEEWGGETVCCNVSAKTGEGIPNLLEMVNLVADTLELRANPDRQAVGTVIEARLDKGKGSVASLLVQKGTLRQGDVLIAGTAVGRVRTMCDHHGAELSEAGPSVPVEITGLSEVPAAGDKFAVVADEKLARELAEKRRYEAKEEEFNKYRKVTLDNLFDHIEEGTMKELRVIVKGDVGGSVEAVKSSLEKLTDTEVRLRVIHSAVGAVSESDVMLAGASEAVVVAFNVSANPAAETRAKEDGVEIKRYSVIYDAIEELGTAMKGMLAPKFKENEIAKVEVRSVFRITGVGVVAGCYVLSGKVLRGCEVRVTRDGIVMATDKITGLKRFKDDVKEVAESYECGISLDKFSDIKEGDIFECFIVEQVKP